MEQILAIAYLAASANAGAWKEIRDWAASRFSRRLEAFPDLKGRQQDRRENCGLDARCARRRVPETAHAQEGPGRPRKAFASARILAAHGQASRGGQGPGRGGAPSPHRPRRLPRRHRGTCGMRSANATRSRSSRRRPILAHPSPFAGRWPAAMPIRPRPIPRGVASAGRQGIPCPIQGDIAPKGLGRPPWRHQRSDGPIKISPDALPKARERPSRALTRRKPFLQ